MVREERLELSHLWRQNLNLVRLPISPFPHGVADGVRTHDNWNHNPGLYQLSYSHHVLELKSKPPMARPAGVEPATHGLEGRCSIQLS